MKNRKLLSLILFLLLTGCANKPTVSSEESSTPLVTSISEDISSTSTEDVTSEDPTSSEDPITSEPAFGGYYEGYDLTKTGTDLKNEIKRQLTLALVELATVGGQLKMLMKTQITQVMLFKFIHVLQLLKTNMFLAQLVGTVNTLFHSQNLDVVQVEVLMLVAIITIYGLLIIN